MKKSSLSRSFLVLTTFARLITLSYPLAFADMTVAAPHSAQTPPSAWMLSHRLYRGCARDLRCLVSVVQGSRQQNDKLNRV